MPKAKSIVKWGGVALIVAGVVAASAPLFFGYAPIAAPAWWGLYFNLFWGGIAAIVVGVLGAIEGAYYMEEEEAAPFEGRRMKREISA